jgi:uncharacterized membrane protein YeaQ/YmgE (transglycosylase-associated protein family)
VESDDKPYSLAGATLDTGGAPRHAVCMTLAGLLVLLVIAGVCGAIGSAVARSSRVGCLGSIALGFVGAWLGMWFARHLHLPVLYVLHVQNEAFPVVWSILGAAIVSAVVSALTRRGPYGF